MPISAVPRFGAPDRCRHCTARNTGICAWFAPEEGREIAHRSTRSLFSPRSQILVQGEVQDRIGVIVSGLVKIVLNDERGEEHLLQLLHAGEIVGDPLSSECAFSWEAATEVDLCWLPPSTLSAATRHNPEAYQRQLDALLWQVHEQQFAQAALRGRNSLQRLANWLLLQLPPETAPAPVRMRILLTRRDLASLLEMTVETLCRVLHQAEERGAIRLVTPDLVELRDRPRLRLLARSPDRRLQQTLLRDGWEWGARSLAPALRAMPRAKLTCVPPALTEPAEAEPGLTRIKDVRRVS